MRGASCVGALARLRRHHRQLGCRVPARERERRHSPNGHQRQRRPSAGHAGQGRDGRHRSRFLRRSGRQRTNRRCRRADQQDALRPGQEGRLDEHHPAQPRQARDGRHQCRGHVRHRRPAAPAAREHPRQRHQRQLGRRQDAAERRSCAISVSLSKAHVDSRADRAAGGHQRALRARLAAGAARGALRRGGPGNLARDWAWAGTCSATTSPRSAALRASRAAGRRCSASPPTTCRSGRRSPACSTAAPRPTSSCRRWRSAGWRAGWPSPISWRCRATPQASWPAASFRFPWPAENNKITVEFKKFGVGLAFTPTVLDDGLINIKIEPEVSELDPTTSLRVERRGDPEPDRSARANDHRAARRPELRHRGPV